MAGPLILPRAFFDVLRAGRLGKKDVGIRVKLGGGRVVLWIEVGGASHGFEISRRGRGGRVRVLSLDGNAEEETRGWAAAAEVVRGDAEAAWVGDVMAGEGGGGLTGGRALPKARRTADMASFPARHGLYASRGPGVTRKPYVPGKISPELPLTKGGKPI